jgi:hypothetical protein
MAPVTTPPLPGSMTVPVWYGWQAILVLLVLVALAAVVFFVIAANGSAGSQRADWRAWLDERSGSGRERDAHSTQEADAGVE